MSIIPSETFHIEDDAPLTDEMRLEAKRMVENEQLRRRDPQAHNEMVRAKAARQLQSVLEHTKTSALNVRPADYIPPSTEPVPWSSAMGPGFGLPFSPYNNPIRPSHIGDLPTDNRMLGIPIASSIDGLGLESRGTPMSGATGAEKSSSTRDIEVIAKEGSHSMTQGSEINKPQCGWRSFLPWHHSTSNAAIRQEALNSSRSGQKRFPATEPLEGGISFTDGPVNEIHNNGRVLEESSGRKHNIPQEQVNHSKKIKLTPRASPNFTSVGPMENSFQQLLDKEAARSKR